MNEAIIYACIIIGVSVVIFGLCFYGSRVQRASDESRDYRKDIEAERASIDRLGVNKRKLEEEQRDRTETLKQNNRTARDANSRIGEILRGAKKIQPTRED